MREVSLNYLRPEVVIVGMEYAAACRAINKIATHLKNGETIKTMTRGVPHEGFCDATPLIFKELRMAAHTEELGFAIWFYCSRSADSLFQSIRPCAGPLGPLSVRPSVRFESNRRVAEREMTV